MRISPCLPALLALLVLSLPARMEAQTQRLLIISQPPEGAKKEEIVDFAPFLKQALAETGRYEVIVFRPGMPEIAAAINAGKLTVADLNAPISLQTAQKIAGALSAAHVLRVSGRRAKEGIEAEAQMESRVGQDAWRTAFNLTLPAYRPRNRNSVLEGINAQTGAILERITGDRAGPLSAQQETITPPQSDKTDTSQPTRPPDTPVSKPDPPANTPSATMILIDRFRKQGDTANLILSLRQAINEKPREPRLRKELIQAYQERGWDAAARDEASRAVAILPDDPTLRRLLGDGFLAAGDMEAAIREYQEAIRLNGKDAASHVALGNAYWQCARLEDALTSYAAGAQADPQSPLPHRRLGRIHALRGRYAESLAAMKTAKELSTPETMPDYAAETADLMRTLEGSLLDSIAKMQKARKDLLSGTRTREQLYTEISGEKKRVLGIADYLNDLPAAPGGYAQVQALYAQAAALIAQAADAALSHLETRSESDDREATLQRLEAGKQIAEASKRLKALQEKANTAR
jgi:Flp pilus assembly protein TadD